MFEIYQAPGPEHLLEHVAFFVVQCRTAHMSDAVGPVYDEVLFYIRFSAIWLLFFHLRLGRKLEGPVARVFNTLGDLVESPIPFHFLELRSAGCTIFGFREPQRIINDLIQR